MKSLSRVRPSATPWTAAFQASPSWGFPGRSSGVGCHRLLQRLLHCRQAIDCWATGAALPVQTSPFALYTAPPQAPRRFLSEGTAVITPWNPIPVISHTWSFAQFNLSVGKGAFMSRHTKRYMSIFLVRPMPRLVRDRLSHLSLVLQLWSVDSFFLFQRLIFSEYSWFTVLC